MNSIRRHTQRIPSPAFTGAKCGGLICLVLMIAACDQKKPVADLPPRVVKIASVGAPTDTAVLTTAGVLRARNRASLSFQVPGRVVEMPVEMGDWLAAGAKLAALDSSAYELRLKQAEADLMMGRSALAERQWRFDSSKLLLPKRAISQAEYEQAEAALEAGKAQVAVAEAAERLARRDLEHTVLVAPCAGRVVQRHLQNFSEVTAGAPVIEFDGDGIPEVLAQVPEVFARTLNAGDRAHITPQGGENRVLQASICQISSRSDAGAGVPVILKLDSAAADLRPGLTVEVAFQRSGGVSALVVPTVALLAGPQTNSASVFVYHPESESVSKRRITLGEPLREGMSVTSGLQSGEMIVLAGVPFLSDGQRVRTVSTPHSSPSQETLMLSKH